MKRRFFYIFLLIFVVGFLVGRFSTFDKINSIFSNLNIFTARISPEKPLFEDSGLDLSEINLENLLPEKEAAPVAEELTEKKELEGELSEVGQIGQQVGPKPQLTLIEIQETLDDIAEQIDVINQEVTELMVEIWETTEQEAAAEEEIVIEEELEDEEEKEGICPDGIDINTASKKELEKIAGVGPVIAQRIIDARPFYSFNDLLRVSGIGEKTLQGIIEHGCAYIEDDMGSDSSGLISVPGGGGGAPPPVTYPKILISEIQITGEEDEKEEFVELYNPNETDVILTNWYLQRKTKSGSDFSTFAPKTLFSGKTIKAKDYFLIVREDSSFVDLADIITDYPLTEDNTLALKDPNKEIRDKVGWGEAQDFETASFPQNPEIRDPIGDWLSEIGFKGSREPFLFTIYYQSLGRKIINEENNYQDTDDNAVDFEIQTPTPKAKNKTFTEVELEDVLKNIIDYYNTLPETEIISGPTLLTSQTQAIFGFQATKEYCHFECQLNEQGWKDCQSPKIYEDLEEGQYTFLVRAIDLFSNIDLTPAEYSWIIKIPSEEADTTPPQVVFNLDSLQTSLSFTISWSGEDLAQEGVIPSGIEGFLLRYSEDKESWTYWPEDLSFTQETQYNFTGEDEKTYYFQIKAKDIAGNESEWVETSTKISLPKNFLQNPYFDDGWEGTATSGNPNDWTWGYRGGLTLEDSPLVSGKKSFYHEPYSTYRDLIQFGKSLEAGQTYYGEIWAEGTGRVKLGIDHSGDTKWLSFRYTDFDNAPWTKMAFSGEIIADTNNGGIRIRMERLTAIGERLVIGAAWFSTAEPPENWPPD